MERSQTQTLAWSSLVLALLTITWNLLSHSRISLYFSLGFPVIAVVLFVIDAIRHKSNLSLGGLFVAVLILMLWTPLAVFYSTLNRY